MAFNKPKHTRAHTSGRYETTYSSSFKPIPKKNDRTQLLNEKILSSRKVDSESITSNRSTESDYLTFARIDPKNYSYQHMIQQIAKITDSLYLSGITPINQRTLEQLGITLVVSLVLDLPAHIGPPASRVIHITIEDVESANIRQHFEHVTSRIHGEIQKHGKVLVHCVAGISRSSTIVLAYLMKYHGKNLREAYLMTLNSRPYIQPNLGFWRHLIGYERTLFGSNTVNMIPHKTHRHQLVPDVPPSALSLVLSTMPSFSNPQPTIR